MTSLLEQLMRDALPSAPATLAVELGFQLHSNSTDAEPSPGWSWAPAAPVTPTQSWPDADEPAPGTTEPALGADETSGGTEQHSAAAAADGWSRPGTERAAEEEVSPVIADVQQSLAALCSTQTTGRPADVAALLWRRASSCAGSRCGPSPRWTPPGAT